MILHSGFTAGSSCGIASLCCGSSVVIGIPIWIDFNTVTCGSSIALDITGHCQQIEVYALADIFKIPTSDFTRAFGAELAFSCAYVRPVLSCTARTYLLQVVDALCGRHEGTHIDDVAGCIEFDLGVAEKAHIWLN